MRRRKASERAKLKPFTPLQVEALSLSAQLLQFIKYLESPPTPKYTREQIDDMPPAEIKRRMFAHDRDFEFACEFYYGGASTDGPRNADQLERNILARTSLLDPWYDKISASYILQFQPTVERMRNQFRAAGEPDSDNALLMPVQGRSGRENIKAIARKLWELAYKIQEKEAVIETI